MEQRYKNLISFIVLIIVIWYVSLHYKEFLVLQDLSARNIFEIGIVLFVFFFATGFTFSLLVKLAGTRLSGLEIVALSFLTNMINYIAPLRPGAVVKAMYLKSSKNLNYSNFSSIFAANAFLSMATTSVVAILLLGLNWSANGVLPHELLAVSVILLFLSISPFLFKNFSWIKIKREGKIAGIINNAINAFEQLREQKKGIALICGSIVIQFLIAGVTMMQVYGAIGIDLTYQMALMLGVFTALANLFTITPNNMGVQETVMGYLVMVMGGDFNQGIVGAAILRAIHVALTFSLGSILVHRMLVKSNLTFRQMLPN